jgi:hypothetical protein
MRCQCEKISTLGDCYYCVSGMATGPLHIRSNFTKMSPQVGKISNHFFIAFILMFTSLILNQKELLGLTPVQICNELWANSPLPVLNLHVKRYETEVALFLMIKYRARNFKLSWSPGIDSKEPFPPAYVAWRGGTMTLFLLGS